MQRVDLAIQTKQAVEDIDNPLPQWKIYMCTQGLWNILIMELAQVIDSALLDISIRGFIDE